MVKEWEWEDMQTTLEKRLSYSVERDRKSSIQGMSSGNLIPAISLTLPILWTVNVCRCLPEWQNSNTFIYLFFWKFKLFLWGREVSLYFSVVATAWVAGHIAWFQVVDSQRVHVHLLDLEFTDDVSGPLAAPAWVSSQASHFSRVYKFSVIPSFLPSSLR